MSSPDAFDSTSMELSALHVNRFQITVMTKNTFRVALGEQFGPAGAINPIHWKAAFVMEAESVRGLATALERMIAAADTIQSQPTQPSGGML